MNIINECGCIYEHLELEQAIVEISLKENARIRGDYGDEYRIYRIKSSGYPMISIGHKKYRLHELLFNDKGNLHVHHINGNILDNRIENLMLTTNSEHAKIHKSWEKISKEKQRENAKKGAEKRKRKDVSKDIVEYWWNKGWSALAIADKLKCGVNTVYRRLGMIGVKENE